MKNIDIINLRDRGLLDLSGHCLLPDESYGLVKFRLSFRKALEKISAAEVELLGVVSIDDPVAFDQELKSLRGNPSRSELQNIQLVGMEDRIEQYSELRSKLMSEEAPELFALKLPYDKWKKLQDENCHYGKDSLSGWAEDALEGIMWVAPEENKNS